MCRLCRSCADLLVHHAFPMQSQGGGVVDALLKSGNVTIRALTRDPASDKAKALSARGVQVVQADLNDSASIAKVCRTW